MALFQEVKEELRELEATGHGMLTNLFERGKKNDPNGVASRTESDSKGQLHFELHYQRWYTLAAASVSQILPERAEEFRQLYQPDSKRKEIKGPNYSIQDWLTGIRSPVYTISNEKVFDDFGSMTMRFGTQLQILKTCKHKLESKVANLSSLLQADLLDSELASARELEKPGFVRAAGTVAGVVLEGHLKKVGEIHDLKSRKKSPTIGDYNELLKTAEVIDTPNWRNIQRLADVRNLCVHSKEREPTKEEVEDLISSVDRIIKTVF